MKRRKEQVTTSSHEEKAKENRQASVMSSSSKGGGRHGLTHISGQWIKEIETAKLLEALIIPKSITGKDFLDS